MDLHTRPDGSVHLHVPANYAPTLGADGAILLDWFSSALIALARLRDGDPQMSADDWHWLINDLEHRLAPRLQGIRDALIRAHAAAGGSYGDLALAMDVSKGTAQYRRDRLAAAAPSSWESWARGTLPGHPASATWSAQVTVTRNGTTDDINIDGLTDRQATELETLISLDDHTVTVITAAGRIHTFASTEVQMVRVSHTAARTFPTADRTRGEAHAALCATGCHAYVAGECQHCGHPHS
ncbi:hypothetical protein [Salinispora oceanensis]|uniref:hypothetical protein n=1 Tax=Salinispora oceanensis TaxID=1050199 RepID=UPI00035C6643|nr:hypothetical protein [Salinispora oceanensis]